MQDSKFGKIFVGVIVGVVSFLSLLSDLLPAFIAPIAIACYCFYILRSFHD